MSRLADALTTLQGREKKPVPMMPSVVITQDIRLSDWQAATIYTMGVKIEARMFHVDPPSEQALGELRRNIIEEVFGEFRPRIRAISRALLELDTDKARAELTALECQMFEVGR